MLITIGDALNSAEGDLFVGRSTELDGFLEWLNARNHETRILNVSGQPGIGKSALLRAFRRAALAQGRSVLMVDADDPGVGSGAWLHSLPDAAQEPLLISLAETGLVILIDDMRPRTRTSQHLFERFLPTLKPGTHVVVAGRESIGLRGPEGDLWRARIQAMRLEGLPQAGARELLIRSGVCQGATLDVLIRAGGGSPLALSLMARIGCGETGADITAWAEWPLVVREVAARLLDEVEPGLRPLVSACAVVVPVDESTLAEIAPDVESGAAFDRLSRLSYVLPTQHGLAMHANAREILVHDLHWRRPADYRALSRWARCRTAPDQNASITTIRARRRWLEPIHARLTAPDADAIGVDQLTRREREVVELIAAGHLSNRDIAERLVISLGTANLHVKHILHKLGFVNRTALAVWWMQHSPRSEQVS